MSTCSKRFFSVSQSLRCYSVLTRSVAEVCVRGSVRVIPHRVVATLDVVVRIHYGVARVGRQVSLVHLRRTRVYGRWRQAVRVQRLLEEASVTTDALTDLRATHLEALHGQTH